MVYSCEGERVRELMAMGPERSKPLHNFTLPFLKWGSQKHLRCMKIEEGATAASTAAGAEHRNQNQRRRSLPSKFEASIVFGIRSREAELSSHKHNLRERRLRISKGEAEGIEEVREKIMKDLKTAADKIKDAIFREEVSDGEDEEFEETERKLAAEKEKSKEKDREQSQAVEADARPWNLRTRRAACKAPIAGASNTNSSKALRIDDRKANNAINSSPMRNEMMKSPRVRERGTAVAEKERPKFAVALSKREIEEDFMEILGHRPPRRPKKRPRIVQKQLDSLFPGLWLTEVSPDAYKVPETADNGKR